MYHPISALCTLPVMLFPAYQGNLITVRELRAVNAILPYLVRQIITGNHRKAQAFKELRLVGQGKKGLYPQLPAFLNQHIHNAAADALANHLRCHCHSADFRHGIPGNMQAAYPHNLAIFVLCHHQVTQIFIDGIDVSKEDLKSISWNLEPSKEKYKNKTVRKSIEKSIIKNKCSDTFEDIVEAFYLDERRHDIKLQYLSGERWRASAALGYVSGKSIFYAPYENTSFYHSMYGSTMFKALRYLADKGTIIVLPVGSDTFIKF